MKNKTIWAILIATTILVLIPTTFFIFNFKDHILSPNITDWASFGSYFGGIIQPIISLVSLFVLAYITFLVSKISSKENLRISILQRRLDAFDDLAKYQFRLQTVPTTINRAITAIVTRKRGGIAVTISDVQEESEEIRQIAVLYAEYSSYLNSFDLRYGHLFDYDFSNQQFIDLKAAAKKISIAFGKYYDSIYSKGLIEHIQKYSTALTDYLPHLETFIAGLKAELKE